MTKINLRDFFLLLLHFPSSLFQTTFLKVDRVISEERFLASYLNGNSSAFCLEEFRTLLLIWHQCALILQQFSLYNLLDKSSWRKNSSSFKLSVLFKNRKLSNKFENPVEIAVVSETLFSSTRTYLLYSLEVYWRLAGSIDCIIAFTFR